MNSNIGTTDRIIRAILGIAIIGFAVVSHGPVRWVGIVGAIFLITAVIRFCPLYRIFGIRTCQIRTT